MINATMVSGLFLGNLIYRKCFKKQNWKSTFVDATGVTLITVILYSFVNSI